eukprot:g24558.t1
MTSVALRGDDSVVAVTQKKVPDKLMDKDFGTHLYNITPNVGCLMTGMSPDARALVYRAREIAAKFKDKNAYEIPVHYLALKLANIAQAIEDVRCNPAPPINIAPLRCTPNTPTCDPMVSVPSWFPSMTRRARRSIRSTLLASDIEVGVVSKSRKGFFRLTEAEIDAHLTAIVEKDA